jgi:hypothetical protein
MFSAVTLLPEKDVGFVFMINGDAAEARAVLTQLLTKHFTRPDDRRTLTDYVQEIKDESVASTAPRAPDVSQRRASQPAELADYLGVYEDPWFGRVDVCATAGGVSFRAHKSPLLSGTVVVSLNRTLVDWRDDSVDAEAWLNFQPQTSGAPTLTMTKVDPDADFSFDFEDLAFTRVGACP